MTRCRCLVLLFVLLAVLPLAAQEERWQQLSDQAGQLYSQGRYAEAIPLLQEAAQVAEKSFGADDLRLATTLNGLARVYREQGQYAEAEPLFQRALRIREKALGAESPDVAPTLNDLADLYVQQGRYGEAEPLLQRALRIREKALGPEQSGVAESLNTLAALYYYQGRYAEAEPLYQRALRIWEKAVGPEDILVATCLDNLAQLYRQQGRYLQAEPLSRRAVQIMEKRLGPQHPELALTLSNLASLYQGEGRYAEAEPLYRRALSIDEKALGAQHPAVAEVLNNLGTLDWEQGRYAEAEPLLQRALRIWVQTLGPVHPQVGTALSNLGALYSYQNRYAEAEQHFQLAIRVQERSLGAESPALISSLGGLAGVYRDQGRLAEAEPLYQRALRISEKALGPEHPDGGTTLVNLAGLYREQGRFAEAQAANERALRIYEAALGPEHLYAALSWNDLAVLHFAQGRPQAAQLAFARSLGIFARRFQYSFTYMSERERLAFLDSVLGAFPLYFSFCVSYAPQMPALPGSMYDVVLWQKGFVGQSIAAMRAKIAASGDPEALKLLDQLTALKQQLSALLNSPGADRAAWQKQVAELQAQADAIEQQLVRRSAALQEDKKLERVSWRDVQKALRPGEAAVEVVKFRFYDGKKWTDSFQYAALIVTPASKDAPQLIVIGDAKQLEGRPVSLYREQVATSRGMEPAEAAAGQAAANATSFYDSFWKPLEPALKGMTRVYLAADGVLNQMSLGVAPAPGGKLFMQEYDLRLVSSTKELLRESKPAAGREAVLVGNPTFLLTPEQYGAALRQVEKPGAGEAPVMVAAASFPAAESVERSRDLKTRGQCSPPPPEGGVLCPLPGTAAELESVSSLLKGKNWQVSAYHDQAALEEAVKAVHHPRLLHLATHGFFLSDQQVKQRERSMGPERPSGMEDPMLRSGLLFAGSDLSVQGQAPGGDLDDGVLTAYEASTLDLQGTELVVLSACETGLGQVQAGEGVFGLRRALEIAGAQSVMMTLWSVPDRETQELMTLFYGKWLGGMEKHEALRQAQLAEREVVRKRYGRDLPYYWGAFVLVGK